MGTRQQRYSKGHYALLGRLFHQKMPSLAGELMEAYMPESEKPKEEDFSKIGSFFKSYCASQDLNPEDYYGPLYKASKIEVRRLFIAVMLHLYNPQVYRQPKDNISVVTGFVSSLAGALQTDVGNTSKMIREVIQWEQSYEEFENRVHDLVVKIYTAG